MRLGIDNERDCAEVLRAAGNWTHHARTAGTLPAPAWVALTELAEALDAARTALAAYRRHTRDLPRSALFPG